jgi:hypothetical protein
MDLPGVSLEPLPRGPPPSTFEVVACHAAIGRYRVTVVDRHGFQPVIGGFFDELFELLKRLAVLSSVASTHQSGGTLDAVASHLPTSVSTLDVDDFIDTDHKLLWWSVASSLPPESTFSVVQRSRQYLDWDLFRSKLLSSAPCQPQIRPSNVNDAAKLYDDIVVDFLNCKLPARPVVRHPRPSDLWFNADCRLAKRYTRRWSGRPRWLSELLDSVDRGNTVFLARLDLSAAFDTVDHNVLLNHLYVFSGISSSLPSWFRFYISGRRWSVCCGNMASSQVDVSDVRQEPIIGPIVFLIYSADLPSVITAHGMCVLLSADDSHTQRKSRDFVA